MSKIFIFRNTRKDFIFTAEYIQVIVEELVKRGHEVTAYDPKRRRIMDFSSRKCKTIFSLPKKLEVPFFYIPLNILALIILVIKNRRKYDFATFMYCRLEYIVLAKLLFKVAKINYVLIFGSDFKLNKKNMKKKLYFLENINLILFPSEELREYFLKNFNDLTYLELEKKTKHFPLPIVTIDKLKCISKNDIRKVFKKYNISEGSKTVFLGTCASKNEQHIRIIDSLAQLENKGVIRSTDLTLIFPLTYSASRFYEKDKISTISYAKKKLQDYNCVFLTTYLPAEEYLALLKGSDIFVNMRISDQFAASVIEALYSGTIVVSGSWQPYSKFIAKHEIALLEIDDVSKVNYEIEVILNDFKKYKQIFNENKEKMKFVLNNVDSINRYCEIFQQEVIEHFFNQ
ncbi:MAG: glycosyltransferase [Candidatus Marinimicrobia bacterium]|nr:glycosyltransferase [Candidatus Neomarinimicrobiota bacterium]